MGERIPIDGRGGMQLEIDTELAERGLVLEEAIIRTGGVRVAEGEADDFHRGGGGQFAAGGTGSGESETGVRLPEARSAAQASITWMTETCSTGRLMTSARNCGSFSRVGKWAGVTSW